MEGSLENVYLVTSLPRKYVKLFRFGEQDLKNWLQEKARSERFLILEAAPLQYIVVDQLNALARSVTGRTVFKIKDRSLAIIPFRFVNQDKNKDALDLVTNLVIPGTIRIDFEGRYLPFNTPFNAANLKEAFGLVVDQTAVVLRRADITFYEPDPTIPLHCLASKLLAFVDSNLHLRGNMVLEIQDELRDVVVMSNEDQTHVVPFLARAELERTQSSATMSLIRDKIIDVPIDQNENNRGCEVTGELLLRIRRIVNETTAAYRRTLIAVMDNFTYDSYNQVIRELETLYEEINPALVVAPPDLPVLSEVMLAGVQTFRCHPTAIPAAIDFLLSRWNLANLRGRSESLHRTKVYSHLLDLLATTEEVIDRETKSTYLRASREAVQYLDFSVYEGNEAPLALGNFPLHCVEEKTVEFEASNTYTKNVSINQYDTNKADMLKLARFMKIGINRRTDENPRIYGSLMQGMHYRSFAMTRLAGNFTLFIELRHENPRKTVPDVYHAICHFLTINRLVDDEMEHHTYMGDAAALRTLSSDPTATPSRIVTTVTRTVQLPLNPNVTPAAHTETAGRTELSGSQYRITGVISSHRYKELYLGQRISDNKLVVLRRTTDNCFDQERVLSLSISASNAKHGMKLLDTFYDNESFLKNNLPLPYNAYRVLVFPRLVPLPLVEMNLAMLSKLVTCGLEFLDAIHRMGFNHMNLHPDQFFVDGSEIVIGDYEDCCYHGERIRALIGRPEFFSSEMNSLCFNPGSGRVLVSERLDVDSFVKVALFFLSKVETAGDSGLVDECKRIEDFLKNVQDQLSEGAVHINELFWFTVSETFIALTVFRDDMDTSLAFSLGIVIFVKILYWITTDRYEYYENRELTGSWIRQMYIQALPFVFSAYCLWRSLVAAADCYENGASISVLFAFEYAVLFVNFGQICSKIPISRNEERSSYKIYIDLVADVLRLILYTAFFIVIMRNYGLPLNIFRDLYLTVRSVLTKLNDYLQFRKATANMEERYANATPEEINATDKICIICREEMEQAKKLPCGHMFHIRCLKSWLERQQSCPTCRRSVLQSQQDLTNGRDVQNNVENAPGPQPNSPVAAAAPVEFTNGIVATPLYPTIAIPLEVIEGHSDLRNIQLQDLSDEQLRIFESTLRENLLKRVEYLQGIQTVVGKLAMQMNQYMTSAQLGDSERKRETDQPGTSSRFASSPGAQQ